MSFSRIRLFATAPRLPALPFDTIFSWEKWLEATISECVQQHAVPFDNIVVLPELANLPVVTTGFDWKMRLARRFIDRTNLAMLLVGGTQAVICGFRGVMRAQESKLVESLHVYRRIAQKYHCYLVSSGFFLDGGRLVNRLWVINPYGAIIHTYDKQRLTQKEEALGVAIGGNVNPFFHICETRLAAVICFDMFDTKIQDLIKHDSARALIVPSANPCSWTGYAESGAWQPEEWLEGSNWVMEEGERRLFVNSMLVGSYGATKFDGQPFIRGHTGMETCGFPEDGKCNLPGTGFYPRAGEVVYADLP